MNLTQLAHCMRAYLSPDFSTTDRTDIRTYALANLEHRGVDTFALRSLDLVDLTGEVERLAGERQKVAA